MKGGEQQQQIATSSSRAQNDALQTSTASSSANTVTSTNAITVSTKKSKYVRDFESLFIPIQKDYLRDKARSGSLRHCQFRSLCWRYFLRCLPERYENWIEYCATSRERYEAIKDRHLPQRPNSEELGESGDGTKSGSNIIETGRNANLKKTDAIKSDNQILSREINRDKSEIQRRELREEREYLNAINQCDHKNLFRTIERDVVRTFPDMEFFRQVEMQRILENVLFNFANENPSIAYKQGMHELLAILLYVLYTDSQNCQINHQGGYANETIATLLDINHLEHDAFYLFSALMKSIQSWYQNDEILIYSSETKDDSRQRAGGREATGRQQVSSVLSIKLKMISESIVQEHDPELFNHLDALQIAPQIYGIRWMRLLFGREFEFLDLLTVWDAIICDTNSMSLVDYIFASMLITLREELVNGDYTDCLNNLMRHQFKDVQYVIKLALHLRDPNNCDRPSPPPYGTSPRAYKTVQNIRAHHGQAVSARSSAQFRQLRSQRANTKEFEMHEIQPSGTQTIRPQQGLMASHRQQAHQQHQQQAHKSRGFPSPRIFSAQESFNVSSESHDDLHSVVDYCWRLLSEQIDSLQRCLPKEKCLHSEDEIFVALAQLKKVRDVLKGSLRLEDELGSHANSGTISTGSGSNGGGTSSSNSNTRSKQRQ